MLGDRAALPEPLAMCTSALLRVLSLLLVSLNGLGVRAQATPAANAIKLPDSLVCVSATFTGNASLVWHPVDQRYHSLRPGTNSYPLETWLPTGGLSISQTTCGVDSRGLWYNPNTAQIERNCFNAIGWATMGIDGALNATNAFTMLHTGMLQPNAQSVGAYDPTTNSVLFYNAGSLHRYSHATGTLIGTTPLTGVALTGVALYFVLYTGQSGYEVGLYDCTSRRVLLFNKITGAFTGMSQLPASAVATTAGSFRFAYTNNRFWLFNSALKKWNAYCIWQQVCDATLPVELLSFTGACEKAPMLNWSTGSERNSSHFEVQRSTDLHTWDDVARLPAQGNSMQRVEYDYHDPHAPASDVLYYRLRQVDLDGTHAYFGPVAVATCVTAELMLYPNPNNGDRLNLIMDEVAGDVRTVGVVIYDAFGERACARTMTIQDGSSHIVLELNGGLTAGFYVVHITAGGIVYTERLVIQP